MIEDATSINNNMILDRYKLTLNCSTDCFQ
jgi:hypothetical protein